MHLKDRYSPCLTAHTHAHGLYTIGDEDASQHGAKDDAESNGLEAQRWHVTARSERPILLLKGGEPGNNFKKSQQIGVSFTTHIVSLFPSTDFPIKSFCLHLTQLLL